MTLKSLPVGFSPRARQDLLDIGDHIARDCANARRFVVRLMDQCVRIGRAPSGYVVRNDLAAGLRMAPLGRYIIFFRIVGDAVRIERMLHGARDLPTLFGATTRP